ncbi:unnamed protein product [Discosporangium mesarthrocarpum]
MVARFMRNMSDRWRAHLVEWDLPGQTPSRRSSPRLSQATRSGRDSRGRGSGIGGGGHFVGEGLQEESEDVFFALWVELVQTETFVLGMLLSGTPRQKVWVETVAAQLIRARVHHSGIEVAGDCDDIEMLKKLSPRDAPDGLDKFDPGGASDMLEGQVVSGHVGTSHGHGHSRGCGRGQRKRVTPALVTPGLVRTAAPCHSQGSSTDFDGNPDGNDNVSSIGDNGCENNAHGKDAKEVVPSWKEIRQGITLSKGKEGCKLMTRVLATPESGSNVSNVSGLGNRSIFSTRSNDSPNPNPKSVANGVDRVQVRGKKGLGEVVGELCLCTAVELREGLEQGLSVRLVQAYLDLVELLGTATTDSQLMSQGQPEVATAWSSPKSNPKASLEQEDAGEVLLSILTQHCISQVTLFQRMVRGGLRFEGVGRMDAGKRSSNGPGLLPKVNVLNLSHGLEGEALSLSQALGESSKCRCRALIMRCTEWLDERHEKGLLLSSSASSDDEGGEGGDTGEACDGGDLRRYKSRKALFGGILMASPRECYAALATALTELETRMSAGPTGLARGVMGLHELVTPRAQSAGGGDGDRGGKWGKDKKGQGQGDLMGGGNVSKLNLLPEALKLRVMLVTEKLYACGRAAALAACTALSTAPLAHESEPWSSRETALPGLGLGLEGAEGSRTGDCAESRAEVMPLLSALEASVIVASDDFIKLDMAVRTWIEDQRLGLGMRGGGDRSFRKKASTVLFKMDRCHLELSRAADKARGVLNGWGQDREKEPKPAQDLHPCSKYSKYPTAGRGETQEEMLETALRVLVAGASRLSSAEDLGYPVRTHGVRGHLSKEQGHAKQGVAAVHLTLTLGTCWGVDRAESDEGLGAAMLSLMAGLERKAAMMLS